ncbi:hypothetical protein GIB67_031521 [Kingdonia uniflora]|uniref:F-box/LRR-repeat protein 15/At3g58940/PEG3-like LRR domain-containing protein n=1 Tax=Kingdonia uniflora TaxID=39325 RepID=A0A7J7MNN9_9MAGN|nr:hypothetical protein GIB67_031521 [Kingdonia uniflora]
MEDKEYLARDIVPEVVPVKSPSLKHLLMDIDFMIPKDIRAAVSLLRSSPNLENRTMQQKLIDGSFSYQGGKFKELVLVFWESNTEQYKLTSNFFSLQYLHSLWLCQCAFTLPPEFEGFRHLQTLYLEMINMTDSIFECLISKCPLLQKLELINFYGCSCLKINAPNLRYLNLDGEFEDIIFKDNAVLSTVTIGLRQQLEDDKSKKLIDLSRSLPLIKSFELKSYFLEYLGVENVPDGLPGVNTSLKFLSVSLHFRNPKEVTALICMLLWSPNLERLELISLGVNKVPVGVPVSACLKFLSVQIGFGNPREVMAVICMLQWSPNLEELEMYVLKDDIRDYPEDFNHFSYSFDKLELIKLNNFSGVELISKSFKACMNHIQSHVFSFSIYVISLLEGAGGIE